MDTGLIPVLEIFFFDLLFLWAQGPGYLRRLIVCETLEVIK